MICPVCGKPSTRIRVSFSPPQYRCNTWYCYKSIIKTQMIDKGIIPKFPLLNCISYLLCFLLCGMGILLAVPATVFLVLFALPHLKWLLTYIGIAVIALFGLSLIVLPSLVLAEGLNDKIIRIGFLCKRKEKDELPKMQ